MESKKQVLDIIAKVGNGRQAYLNELFKYMPEAIAKEMTYLELKKNKNLILAGDPRDTVYIILYGEVAGVDYQKTGRVYSFMDFTRMYIVGDFEVFTNALEYGVSIRTTKDCKLLKISANSYLRWIRHDENALFLRLQNILATLPFERKMDREYLLMGCRERLINFLIKLYERDQVDQQELKISKTQAELADKVGFNLRSVQRNIAALEKEHFISLENGKIAISYEQYLMLKEEDNKEEK